MHKNKNYVSLEVAKLLELAGYKSQCERWWIFDGFGAASLQSKPVGFFYYPAPTDCQLIDELPRVIPGPDVRKTSMYLMIEKNPKGFRASYVAPSSSTIEPISMTDETLSNTLGLLMACLIKNGFIHPAFSIHTGAIVKTKI